jgi:hypothetical protein
MSTSLPNDYRILVGPCPRSIQTMADLQGPNSQGTDPLPSSFHARFASSIVTSISLVFSAVLLDLGEYWFLHFACMSKCKISRCLLYQICRYLTLCCVEDAKPEVHQEGLFFFGKMYARIIAQNRLSLVLMGITCQCPDLWHSISLDQPPELGPER